MLRIVHTIGFALLMTLVFCIGVPLHAQETPQIDLIVEANTRVPSFYEGRALPIANELIKITAIPHVGEVSPASLTYRWKLNNTVLFGGPVPGLYQPTITMPDRSAILGVTVYDSAGNAMGSATVEVETALPELHFYEDNPLRSTSKQAVGDTFTLIGDEVTVRAEPYFTATDISNDTMLMKWTLDGREIQNFGDDPHAITLRGTGGSGNARVGFELVNSSSLQFLQDMFTIHFEN